MTKKPTWPEVWLEIAKAYYTPKKWRTKRQREITYSGLCYAVMVAGDDSHINIYPLNPPTYSGGWWPWNDVGNRRRAEFCEHMAGIPHEDFENFINGRQI